MARGHKVTPDLGEAKPKRPRDGMWRAGFLAALGERGCVLAACQAAGVARAVAYRARAADPAFAADWADALDEGADRLQEEARWRAVEGTRRPLLYKREVVLVWMVGDDIVIPGPPGAKQAVYFEHSYSDALLIFLLKAARPAEFRDNYRVVHAEEPADPEHARYAAELRAMTDEELAAAIAEARAKGERMKGLLGG